MLYGKTLDEWNRLAGLQGAQVADIEVTARLHRCGTFRLTKDGTADSYARVEWDVMNASQRLIWAFDIYAPCCVKKSPRGSKRSVRDVMRDKSIAEQASVRVAGMTPKQLVQAIRPRVGWE